MRSAEPLFKVKLSWKQERTLLRSIIGYLQPSFEFLPENNPGHHPLSRLETPPMGDDLILYSSITNELADWWKPEDATAGYFSRA